MEDNKDEIIGVYTRKTKVTKCVNCGEEIVQGKKEGRLFCEECEKEYINFVQEQIDKLNLEYRDIEIILDPSCRSNASHKHTALILHGFRDSSRVEAWIETENIMKLLDCNSQYIDKYIMANIEASYWFSKSIGEDKRRYYDMLREDRKQRVLDNLPQYEKGEITLGQLARRSGTTTQKVKEILDIKE